MPNWIIDTARLNYAAAQLASFPGTENHLAQLAQFADYLESEATLHHNYFFGVALQAQTQTVAVAQPQQVTLRRGAPMRAQSMTQTPPGLFSSGSEGSSPPAPDESHALFAPFESRSA